MSTTEFQLPSMTCGHCVRAVTQAVQQLDPQAQVRVDLPTHKVAIDSNQPRENLAGALREAGYEPA